MKISFNWLKEYVAISCSAKELSDKLTMAGLEVESVATIKGDTIFEIEVTPNRPDCLNMLGIAREVSAIFNKKLQYPRMANIKFPQKRCSISIEDEKGCSRYIGAVIDHVAVGPSAKSMQQHLEFVGLRPISNIVDITNFCMMEYGQPLHAFDYDKLCGHKIIVRRARKNETIVTIDNVTRKLDESILVIADQEKPVAIAGIMGGKATEVTPETKNILLESAFFDPILIRRASRQLGLSTDSSYRFERGLDFTTVKKTSQRAVNLIVELTGGQIVSYSDSCVLRRKKTAHSLKISLKEINHFLGACITQQDCVAILKKLECIVCVLPQNVLKVTPPSFREDIKSSVDIMEEIARIYGYQHIPSSLPTVKVINIPEYTKRQRRENMREFFIAQGFNEVVTYAMVSEKSLECFQQKDLAPIRVLNPLSQEQEIMRPSLLPSLLAVVLSNMNKNEKDLRLFEIGKIYGLQEEKDTLALVLTGKRSSDWRQLKKEDVNFYDLKGALEQAFDRLGIKNIIFKISEKSFLQKGIQPDIYCGSQKIGYLGKVDLEVLQRWDIKQNSVFYAEICLEPLYIEMSAQEKFIPLCDYPAIIYDISLAIPKSISFDEVKKIAFEYGQDILAQIIFKEEYCGDKIPEGYRGIIFSLTYQSRAKTLTESEVSVIHEAINRALVERLNAIKR